MFDRVREHIGEVIDIANKCPDKYQEKCFEVLLSALVQGESLPVGTTVAPREKPAQTVPTANFFEQNGISSEEYSRVFEYDGSSCSIIVANLKDTAKSNKQAKLALLLGVKGLLETGDAHLSRDSLVELCEEHDAYDKTNFSKHMKGSRKQWLLQRGDGWNLTVPGKKEAAQVIKQLAE